MVPLNYMLCLFVYGLQLSGHLNNSRPLCFLVCSRAPDNFLKQGVADASLEAKGVFLQNAEVFSLPSFTPVRFYKLQI